MARTLNSPRLERFYAQLDALRARLHEEEEAIIEQTRSPSHGQNTGELSNAPYHLGDRGTEEFLHNTNAALAENEQYLLREVQAAIERLETDQFGICTECGGTIPDERLEAIPYARYCVSCAERMQDGPDINLEAGRPRGPELSPDGEMPGSEPQRRPTRRSPGWTAGSDRYAAGTPGGGAAMGGLAGSNAGHGDPEIEELEDAAGGEDHAADPEERREKKRPVFRAGERQDNSEE